MLGLSAARHRPPRRHKQAHPSNCHFFIVLILPFLKKASRHSRLVLAVEKRTDSIQPANFAGTARARGPHDLWPRHLWDEAAAISRRQAGFPQRARAAPGPAERPVRRGASAPRQRCFQTAAHGSRHRHAAGGDRLALRVEFDQPEGEAFREDIRTGEGLLALVGTSTMRGGLATCPGLWSESPGVGIAHPAAPERTSANPGRLAHRRRCAVFGPIGPTPG